MPTRSSWSQRFAGLTRSQLELLKSILRHQRALDEADLRDLDRAVPVPRHAASTSSAGSSPAAATTRARPSATCACARRSSSASARCWKGCPTTASASWSSRASARAKEYAPEEEEEAADARRTASRTSRRSRRRRWTRRRRSCCTRPSTPPTISSAAATPAIPTPLACIKVPELPAFATDHIDKHEQAQLAAEFIDWLLTGNRDGALLRRKALSVESERDYRKAKRDLRQARAKRKKHHHDAPADQDNKKAMSIWEREDAKLAKQIEDLENRIKQADRDRAKRKTILQQLDAAEAGRARVRKFRDETAQARRRGQADRLQPAGRRRRRGVLQVPRPRLLDRAGPRAPGREVAAAGVVPADARRGAAHPRQPRAGLRQHRRAAAPRLPHRARADGAEPPLHPGAHPAREDRPEGQHAHRRAADPRPAARRRASASTSPTSSASGAARRTRSRTTTCATPSSTRPSSASRTCRPILLVLRELGFADVPARCKELSAERFNHAPAILEPVPGLRAVVPAQQARRRCRPSSRTSPPSTTTARCTSTPSAWPRRSRCWSGTCSTAASSASWTRRTSTRSWARWSWRRRSRRTSRRRARSGATTSGRTSGWCARSPAG